MTHFLSSSGSPARVTIINNLWVWNKKYGGFLSHRGTPNHPVVMDDHFSIEPHGFLDSIFEDRINPMIIYLVQGILRLLSPSILMITQYIIFIALQLSMFIKESKWQTNLGMVWFGTGFTTLLIPPRMGHSIQKLYTDGFWQHFRDFAGTGNRWGNSKNTHTRYRLIHCLFFLATALVLFW